MLKAMGKLYVYFLFLLLPFFLVTDIFARLENLDIFEADPFANPDLVGLRKCDICHISRFGGSELNAFGKAFRNAGLQITDDLRKAFPDLFIVAELPPGPPPPPPPPKKVDPRVSLRLNGAFFIPEMNLKLDLITKKGTPDIPVDIYVGLITPGLQTLFFIAPSGFSKATVEPKPFLSQTIVEDKDSTLLDLILPSISVGQYKFFAVLVHAGKDPLDPSNYVGGLEGMAQANFEVVEIGKTTGLIMGKVTDTDVRKGSNAPVVEATVQLEGIPLNASTVTNGEYIIKNVPPGKYFLSVFPSAKDTNHFPGGFKKPIMVKAGEITRADVKLSMRPSDNAIYVGSSICLGCHNIPEIKKTSHFLTLRVPGKPAGLQDWSRLPKLPGETSTDGVIADGDGNGINDFKEGKTITLSDGDTSLRVILGYDEGKKEYFEIINGIKHPIKFSYGGMGFWYQGFVTEINGKHYVLPNLYMERAEAGKRWEPYNLADWAKGILDPSKSFDVECAGCHVTGLSFKRDARGILRVDAVNDARGVVDMDEDGTLDETGVGCERCHGPGSEHAGAGGLGYAIISPRNLTHEAGSLVCGQCHQRGIGMGTVEGAHTGYPTKGNNEGIRGVIPGTSRTEFYDATQGFFTEAPVLWGDEAFGAKLKHSKLHHQQYQEFVQSRMYMNEIQRLTCFDCHSPHGSDVARDLKIRADNNELCLSCHSSLNPQNFGSSLGIIRHMMSKVGMVQYDPEVSGAGRCISCHMPKTGKSGIFIRDERGKIVEGDVRSHTFDPILYDVSIRMALSGKEAIPNSCGSCHRDRVM